MINGVELFFSYLLAICMPSFEKCLLGSNDHFYFCYLLLRFLSSLYLKFLSFFTNHAAVIYDDTPFTWECKPSIY
jgi:hypothetical protein